MAEPGQVRVPKWPRGRSPTPMSRRRPGRAEKGASAPGVGRQAGSALRKPRLFGLVKPFHLPTHLRENCCICNADFLVSHRERLCH